MVLIILNAIVIGACGVVMGLNLSKQSQMDNDFRDMQTAYKLEERRKIDLESYLMLNGIKVLGDDAHGPTGNLQRMLPKEKQDGRR